MRAALLYGKVDLRVQEVAAPEITKHEVLLQVKSAFVCGTDVRMFKNGYKGVSEDSPIILGHELSGLITKVGKNVEGYNEGMAVAVAPNMGCGICDRCVSGNTQLCKDYRALGIHLDGGFAEYVRIPEAAVRQGNIIEILSGMSFEEAAIVDGCSRIKALLRVVLPLAFIGIISVGAYHFVGSWSEFAFASILLETQKIRTAPVGLGDFIFLFY